MATHTLKQINRKQAKITTKIVSKACYRYLESSGEPASRNIGTCANIGLRHLALKQCGAIRPSLTGKATNKKAKFLLKEQKLITISKARPFITELGSGRDRLGEIAGVEKKKKTNRT